MTWTVWISVLVHRRNQKNKKKTNVVRNWTSKKVALLEQMLVQLERRTWWNFAQTGTFGWPNSCRKNPIWAIRNKVTVRVQSRNAKKKRKRISKERVDLNAADAKGPKPTVDGAYTLQNERWFSINRNPISNVWRWQDGHHTAPTGVQKVRQQLFAAPYVPKFRTNVQKQIKDTLARLTTKTKSEGSKYRRKNVLRLPNVWRTKKNKLCSTKRFCV